MTGVILSLDATVMTIARIIQVEEMLIKTLDIQDNQPSGGYYLLEELIDSILRSVLINRYQLWSQDRHQLISSQDVISILMSTLINKPISTVSQMISRFGSSSQHS